MHSPEKHFATEADGCDLLAKLRDRYPDKILYGEAISLKPEEVDEYSKYMDVIVYENCGYYDTRHIYTFVESHDDYLSFHSTNWMSDKDRLNKWMWVTSQYQHCIYYARPNDQTIFCEEMRNINLAHKFK